MKETVREKHHHDAAVGEAHGVLSENYVLPDKRRSGHGREPASSSQHDGRFAQ